MAETVDKFRRDTDIAAAFTSEVQTLDVSAHECRELGRIVNEALTNVRKHSGARAVLVALTSSPQQLHLTIEDDGGGCCDFSGRMSLAELDAAGIGPAMIKESVRAVGGDLILQSLAWKGTKIEVTISKGSSCAAIA
jgi:signal transduction histidine kinase